MAARTVRRTASTPRRWPSNRGRPRACAHRPLPSMMMATWRGALRSGCRFSFSDMSVEPRRRLNLHDFLFLAGEQQVDLLDRLVGRLLHFGFVALAVVLAQRVLLQQSLQHVEAIAAHMAHSDARVLGVFMRHLHHLLAPLLVEFGDA